MDLSPFTFHLSPFTLHPSPFTGGWLNVAWLGRGVRRVPPVKSHVS